MLKKIIGSYRRVPTPPRQWRIQKTYIGRLKYKSKSKFMFMVSHIRPIIKSTLKLYITELGKLFNLNQCLHTYPTKVKDQTSQRSSAIHPLNGEGERRIGGRDGTWEREPETERKKRGREGKKKASSVGPVSFIAGPLHLGFGGVKTSGPSC